MLQTPLLLLSALAALGAAQGSSSRRTSGPEVVCCNTVQSVRHLVLLALGSLCLCHRGEYIPSPTQVRIAPICRRKICGPCCCLYERCVRHHSHLRRLAKCRYSELRLYLDNRNYAFIPRDRGIYATQSAQSSFVPTSYWACLK